MLRQAGIGLLRFGLWCARRPLPMWFVLLWGVVTTIGSTRFLVAHWSEALMYLSAETIVQALAVPGLALTASVLAFCMRKESLAFLGMYFLLYGIAVMRVAPPRPWTTIAFNIVLAGAVLAYLVWLFRKGRLR